MKHSMPTTQMKALSKKALLLRRNRGNHGVTLWVVLTGVACLSLLMVSYLVSMGLGQC